MEQGDRRRIVRCPPTPHFRVLRHGFFFNSQLASVKLQHFESVKQSPKRKTEKSPKTNQTKPQSPLLSLPGHPPWVQKKPIHHVDFVPKVLNDQVHRWLFETSQPNGLHEVWCKFSMWWLHHIYYLGGGFKYFLIPTWGNDPIWQVFFKGGWNHQLVFVISSLGVSWSNLTTCAHMFQVETTN